MKTSTVLIGVPVLATTLPGWAKAIHPVGQGRSHLNQRQVDVQLDARLLLSLLSNGSPRGSFLQDSPMRSP